MFIDTGNGTGWTPVNDSTKDVAALDSFTIDWGSDGIDEQPEPAVMSFTLRDRAGRLAGQALTLAGMKVVVQFSNQPRWMDLTPAMGCWRDLRIPIDSLHKMYSPDSPDSPDSPSETMFAGSVSTGGSIEPASDGGWLLKLSATSRMAIWKRLQSQGPTDTAAKWNGAHWIGTPSARLKEMNRRASAQGAPEAQLDGLALPSSVAPYTPSDHPSQLDLLHRLTVGPRLPQWHEVYDGAVCTQACIDASARLCADIALRYGWTKLWHDGLKGNVWLHREIPGTDHLACPDLAPNGLPYKQIIDKANQILEGGSMSNAGDEVWNWAYKPNGKNATPGGNMYNLLAYELPQRVRDSIMQYSYKGSAPGGNIYNTICFEIPGMLKQLTKTIEQQQQQISELSEKISKLEGTTK